MNGSGTPIKFGQSESSGFRFRLSNIICGQLRSIFRSAFKRPKPHASSLQSISNPSIVTIEDSVEEVEELSPSEQFSWTRMANIFLEFQSIYAPPGDELSLETIQISRNLFDNLLANEQKYSEVIYDSIITLDKSFAERIFHYSQLPKIRPREQLIYHIKKIIELHRIVLYAFENDRRKAVQILNLLALSHVLMKVTITDFRMFDLAIGKFFYRMEMLDDTNVHHMVGYLATATMHVEKLLRRHNIENRKRELLLMDNPEYLVDINSVCRENYRELKKWQQVQLVLRKTVAEREDLLDTSSMKEQVRLESIKSDTKQPSIDSDDIEGWFIEFLKRGYKYKEHDTSPIKYKVPKN